MSGQVQKLAASAQRLQNAVVVSSGLMNKTVKVRVGAQRYNNVIRKKFNHTEHLLVHDPASSLRTGDIISISSGWRVSKNVHHVVRSIVAPFGEPIEARPPVPTEKERMAERVARKEAKNARKKAREDALKAQERGVIPVKKSYTAEELQAIKERRAAKLEAYVKEYEESNGEPIPDELRYRYMNKAEQIEWATTNGRPIPEFIPVVAKEKAPTEPVKPISLEEQESKLEQRQAAREKQAEYYKEKTGKNFPEWRTLDKMNAVEREEWRKRDPITFKRARITLAGKKKERRMARKQAQKGVEQGYEKLEEGVEKLVL